MVTHPTKNSSVALNQAIEIAQGILPREFESWDEVPQALLPTPKARDAQAEGYEAGMRRVTPQVGTIVKAILDGDERIELFGTLTTATSGRSTEFRGKGTNVVEFAEEIAEQQNQLGGILLPTPTTRDYKDGSAEHERDGVVQTDTVARAIFNSGEIELFGTVTTATSGRSPEFRGNGTNVVEFAEEVAEKLNSLLPTPQVDDAKNTGHNQDRRTTLASEVWQTERTTQWGKFEPAIRRWEQVLGRPAPLPTKPDGKEGAHRLSSRFTEWMMGLPDGWITDCGLTRNEELKACGNGVVPQQAELALRILLEGVDFNVQ